MCDCLSKQSFMSLMDNFSVAKYRVVYTNSSTTTPLHYAGAWTGIHYSVCDDSKSMVQLLTTLLITQTLSDKSDNFNYSTSIYMSQKTSEKCDYKTQNTIHGHVHSEDNDAIIEKNLIRGQRENALINV